MSARPAAPGRAGRPHRPITHRVYLFGAAVLLMVALVAHSNYIIGKLNGEARSLCTVLARFFAVATFEAAQDPVLQPIYRDVVRNINFPIVLTDPKGIPRAWRHVGVPPDAVSDSLIAFAEETGLLAPPLERLRDIVADLDRVNEPITIARLGRTEVLGFVHYGESPLVSRLRWVPYLEFAVIAGLLLFGWVGWRSLLAGEQRSLWAALAKETAHQLGTPLSSLLGWTGLLRDQAASGALAPGRVEEIVEEMDRDLDRLNKIASRFAQVGSAPALEPADLASIVSGTVSYFRSRLPQLGTTVTIEERYDPLPRVLVHPQLLEWVVENVLKNALDACDKPAGAIRVTIAWKRDERLAELTIADNGRGMSPEERHHAFDTGFTTKRRGWGLGLALARRVVHEYHGGQIVIAESSPGEGTTIVVTLPISPAPAGDPGS
jgi:NtrC-family two-component system sensor histidine kinase KinB